MPPPWAPRHTLCKKLSQLVLRCTCAVAAWMRHLLLIETIHSRETGRSVTARLWRHALRRLRGAKEADSLTASSLLQKSFRAGR